MSDPHSVQAISIVPSVVVRHLFAIGLEYIRFPGSLVHLTIECCPSPAFLFFRKIPFARLVPLRFMEACDRSIFLFVVFLRNRLLGNRSLVSKFIRINRVDSASLPNSSPSLVFFRRAHLFGRLPFFPLEEERNFSLLLIKLGLTFCGCADYPPPAAKVLFFNWIGRGKLIGPPFSAFYSDRGWLLPPAFCLKRKEIDVEYICRTQPFLAVPQQPPDFLF